MMSEPAVNATLQADEVTPPQCSPWEGWSACDRALHTTELYSAAVGLLFALTESEDLMSFFSRLMEVSSLGIPG